MTRLANKTALITGGTRGIGLGIASAFLAQGARVAISGTQQSSVDDALHQLGAGNKALGITSDLAHPEAPGQLVSDAARALGRIDIVVNNAGIGSGMNIWDLTPAEWDRVHDVNLRAAFFVAREAASGMRGRGGAIINMSSIAGQTGGLAANPAYAASKAAIIGLTKAMAKRLAPEGIRVNCLAPSDIETDMTANWPQDLRDRLNAITPMGRFGTIHEVSGAAVFLASEEASYITGQTISINGGAYLG